MSDKVFVDTNVFLYLYSEDEKKSGSVCTRKWKLPIADIQKAIDEICTACSVAVVEVPIIKHALALHERYAYAYFDCLMLASALSAGCKYLLSEDMANRQVIEDGLAILNIFADLR